MNDCIEEVREHMLAAIELLQEEIKHAPDAATVTKAAKTIGDIDSVLQLIVLRG